MNYFQRTVRFLFSNLHLQVVTIHHRHFSTGNSRLLKLYRQLVILSCYWFMTTYLANYLCFNLGLPPYEFQFDLLSRALNNVNDFRNTGYGRSTSLLSRLLNVISLLTSFRLFRLLYFNADQLVWSHLNDLAVRNREGLKLEWSPGAHWSNRQSDQWWAQRLPFRFLHLRLLRRPRLAFTNRLLHYPNLKEALRIRYLLVTTACELVMTTFILYRLFWFLLRLCNQISLEFLSATITQQLFLFIKLLTFLLWRVTEFSLFFTASLAVYLLCSVYSHQYLQVNSDLGKVKVEAKLKVGTKNIFPQHLSSLRLSRLTSAYRTAHTRLTLFILRLNDSTVSPIIAYYLHYGLPFHASITTNTYFQKMDSSLTRGFIIGLYLFSVLYLAFLGTITLAVARVNHRIAASGQTLAAIFARKGVLPCAGQQEQRLWAREQLKLSTYYQMVWRSEKELAFTAGHMNTTMNWKFALELTLLYSSFVLYFGSKFIKK